MLGVPQMRARMGGQGGQGHDAGSSGGKGETLLFPMCSVPSSQPSFHDLSGRLETTIVMVFLSRPGEKIVFFRWFCSKPGVIV